MTQKNDDMKTALGDLGLTGSLPERMYKHLASLGYTQLSISDRMGQVGGFKTYQNSILTSVPLPVIDYILWLGSSTPAETSLTNTVLGRQEQTLRAKMCEAGIDVPVISKAVGGQTIGTLLSALPGYLTGMGNVVANGKKVGVLINIGSNNIGLTDYDVMAGATKTTMLANLNSIIDQIEAAGMVPILATVHSREGASLIYEEWADMMYRPLIEGRCSDWFDSGLAVFDYCRLYTENDSLPDWYQVDGLHPNVATGHYQEYSAAQLAAKAQCAVAPVAETYIFAWPTTTEYIGGVNQIVGAVTGTFTAGTVRDTKAVINPNVSLAWSGATGSSGGARGNSGIWDIDLTNHRIQSSNLYKSAGTITFTAAFGVEYANLTGVLSVGSNSSTANRFTLVTVGAESEVISASVGIGIAELPFTLDASGNLTFTAAPQAPSTFANVSGVKFVFD